MSHGHGTTTFHITSNRVTIIKDMGKKQFALARHEGSSFDLFNSLLCERRERQTQNPRASTLLPQLIAYNRNAPLEYGTLQEAPKKIQP